MVTSLGNIDSIGCDTISDSQVQVSTGTCVLHVSTLLVLGMFILGTICFRHNKEKH